MADKGKESHGIAARTAESRKSEGAKVPELAPGLVPFTLGGTVQPAPERITVAAHEAASKSKEFESGKKADSARAKGRYRALSQIDVGRGDKAVSILPGVLEEGALTEDEVETLKAHKVLVELSAAEAEEADKQLEAAEEAKEMEAERVAEAKKVEAEHLAELAKAEAEKKQQEADAASDRAKALAADLKKK